MNQNENVIYVAHIRNIYKGGGQFYRWRKPKKTTDLSYVKDL